MTRFLRGSAILVALLLVLGGGLCAWVFSLLSTPIDPQNPAEVVFSVPKGASLLKIGELLEQEGLIRDDQLFRLYLKLNPGGSAKAGKHLLRRSFTLAQIVEELGANPLSEDAPVTMVEGWRLRDADEGLTRLGLISAGAYLAAAREPSQFTLPFPHSGADLEGYLLPDTYLVPKGPLDLHRLIQRQIDALDERFYLPQKKRIEVSGRSLKDLVIMASLLEREEPKPAVRKQVAGLLFKRLDAGTPLGVDATSRYPLDDWSDRTSFLQRLRDPDDVYNTRLRKGLPVGPIGAPSLESLEAALNPEPSRYWYYLHDKDQNIHFAETGQEHEQNRKKYNVY